MPHDPHHPPSDDSTSNRRGVRRTPAPDDIAVSGDTRPSDETPASIHTLSCPFCHSTDVEPLSPFGAQLMTEQYYCHACRTPFERVRDSLP